MPIPPPERDAEPWLHAGAFEWIGVPASAAFCVMCVSSLERSPATRGGRELGQRVLHAGRCDEREVVAVGARA